MSSKKSDFVLSIVPNDGDFKKGFTAKADIGVGDFEDLLLRYRLGDKSFSVKQFGSDGDGPTICTVFVEDLELLPKKKLMFYAVAKYKEGPDQKSNEEEGDLS